MKLSTHESNSGIALNISTLIAILATLAVNTLSNFFPPDRLTIGQIANTLLRGVQITPANYAFAIWGLIYLGLIAYGIDQLRPAQRNQPTIRQINVLLIVACLAQIAWVYFFTLRLFWPSVIAMLGILLSLIGIYLQIGVGKAPVSQAQKWYTQVPFSVYLGWISVATIVNVASALYNAGWDGWGMSGVGWTVIMLIVGAAIALTVAIQRADVAFTLVFIWAYAAIAVRQFDTPPIWITAVVAAIVLSVSQILASNPRS
ncbi:MAG: tryptophan-rich sensory protein [Leptolyngbyaceae cyanobacterium RU_5_1]|nr:tryptophan-rich sensory protein [Leptolyngbyaceae cyanobacterium RU_5_1]